MDGTVSKNEKKKERKKINVRNLRQMGKGRT